MLANRYDRAAEAPIMNTYVPINFDLLYRIGAALKETVDLASRDLSSNIQKWSEFHSPSAVDTLRYYDLTIGKAAPLILELSSNPDLLKTAEGRSRIQQLVNNVDYRSLGILKQSREGMLARLKANQELMAKNMFNHMWHNVDFAGYDTLDPNKGGVFNDVSPLPYMSEVDLVKPYVDNLKASFLGSKKGYLWKGVTEDATDALVTQALSSIQNTPQYAKHIESLMQRGASLEEAVGYINSRLINAGREFAYQDAERDPWWMKYQELQTKYGGKLDPQGINNLTTITYRGGNKHMLDAFTSLTEQLKLDVMGGKKLDPDTQKKMDSEVNPQAVRERLKGVFTSSFHRKANVSRSLEEVVDAISFPASKEAADIFTSAVGGTKIKDGSYIAPSTAGLVLESKFAASALGTTPIQLFSNIKSGADRTRAVIVSDEINKAFEKGDFKEVETVGTGKLTTDGQNVFQRVVVYVPKELIDALLRYKGKLMDRSAKVADDWRAPSTLSKDQLEAAGFKVVKRGVLTETPVKRYDSKGNLESTSITLKNTIKEYVAIPSLLYIPNQGEASITNDALYNKVRGLGTKEGYSQLAYSEEERLP